MKAGLAEEGLLPGGFPRALMLWGAMEKGRRLETYCHAEGTVTSRYHFLKKNNNLVIRAEVA